MGKLYNRRKVKRKKDFRQHVNEFKIQISSPPVSFSRIFTFATVEKKSYLAGWAGAAEVEAKAGS